MTNMTAQASMTDMKEHIQIFLDSSRTVCNEALDACRKVPGWAWFGAGVVLGTQALTLWYKSLEASKEAVEGSDNEELGQHLLNLLYNIAEDQARKDGFVHRGITCNSCNSSPVRGVRYKCANCIDYDLCESCESRDSHNHTHVFLQIRVPIPPLANPRTMLLSPFYPGLATNTGNLKWETICALKEETHFDEVELEAMYEQYKVLSVRPMPEGGIDVDTFHLCLGPLGAEKNLVTDRIFKFFDHDGDDIINFRDLAKGMSVLCKGSQEEKIMYAFKGYDISNTGFISRDDLTRMFKAYFLLSMELVRDVVKALEQEMMANFNDEGDKPVSSAFTAPIPSSGNEVPKSKKQSQDASEDYTEDMPSAVASDTNSSLHPPTLSLTTATNRSGNHSEDLATLMEAMSRDAINEMVATAFESADLDHDDMLSLEEFTRWAASDSTMIQWFDSLGSVF